MPPAVTIEADTHTAPALVNYSLKEISAGDVGSIYWPWRVVNRIKNYRVNEPMVAARWDFSACLFCYTLLTYANNYSRNDP